MFDAANEVLTKHGSIVRLGQRAFSILRALLKAEGATVTKAALMDAAWPGMAVEESNLTVQMTALRRCLKDGHSGDGWIATVPRSGYRFVRLGHADAKDPVSSAPVVRQTTVAITPFIEPERRSRAGTFC